MKNWIDYYDKIADKSDDRFAISEMHFNDSVAGKTFFENEKHRIIKTLGAKDKGGVLVDLGCCAGVILELVQNNFDKCIGVDLSRKSIQHAIKALPEVDFIVDDICNLTKIGNIKADYCITYGVLQFISDEALKGYFSSLISISKPGTRIMVSRVPNKLYYKEYQRYREERNRKEELKSGNLSWNWFSTNYIQDLSQDDFYFIPILPLPDASLPLKAFFDFILIKK